MKTPNILPKNVSPLSPTKKGIKRGAEEPSSSPNSKSIKQNTQIKYCPLNDKNLLFRHILPFLFCHEIVSYRITSKSNRLLISLEDIQEIFVKTSRDFFFKDPKLWFDPTKEVIARSNTGVPISWTYLGKGQDKRLKELTQVFPGIEAVDLNSCCTTLTDVGLKVLGEGATSLKSLDLGYSRDIVWSQLPLPSKKRLCSQITNQGLEDFSKNCRSLQLVAFRNFPQPVALHSITTQGLLNFIASQPHLQSFTLTNSWKIENDFFIHLIQICPQIRHLNLSSCFKINDEALFACNPEKRLFLLESLDFSNCTDLTYKGLNFFLPFCPELTSFAFAVSASEEEDHFPGIQLRNLELQKSCPKLQIINLSGWYTMDDEELKHIVRGLGSLKEIILIDCDSLTFLSIQMLITGYSSLVKINCQGCSKIEKTKIQQLKQQFPKIQILI